MATSNAQPVSSPIPGYVDWIVAAFVTMTGLALAAVGGVMLWVVDRAVLAEELSGGDVAVGTTERTLTAAEQVTFASDVINWSGTGLLVAGAGLTLFGIGYALVCHRWNAGERETTAGRTSRRAAVSGAASATALSFLPFSAVLGGGVAAYLDRHGPDSSVRVGALSGLLTAVPGVVVLAFTTVGLYSGLSTVGESAEQLPIVVLMAAAAVFSVVVTAGLGGLGGYLGDRFATD